MTYTMAMINGKLRTKFVEWITREPPPTEVPPCDYTRLKQEIRPGDVLLIEGRSRVSNIIRSITQSPWTHAALYVGRMDDIEDDEIRRLFEKFKPADDSKRYIIEGLLGRGMVITPLHHYRHHHIRICRPIGLSTADSDLVIAYTIKSVGQKYNVRQLLDLARFLLPWSIMPRRWGSSLFTTPSGEPESGICSSLIAEAFTAVKFPILPFMMMSKESELIFIPSNPYVFTPKDFDYSPYFEIIKYPILNPGEQLPYYRRMPWSEEQVMHQGHGVLVRPKSKQKKPNKLLKQFISRIRKTKVDDTKK
jgi:hypothetical protein